MFRTVTKVLVGGLAAHGFFMILRETGTLKKMLKRTAGTDPGRRILLRVDERLQRDLKKPGITEEQQNKIAESREKIQQLLTETAPKRSFGSVE